MLSSFINYNSSKIHYRYTARDGDEKAVICFHGYGEDSESFSFLEKHLSLNYNIYAIDLPFHGKTEWNEGLECSPDDIDNIIMLILEKHSTINAETILLGYSLGARIALSMVQFCPEDVHKLVLLAPDGLKVNRWYWLSTQTWLGNKFFAFTMKHPGWFFGILRLFNKLGLVNTSIFKFVNYYIGDKEVRRLLYTRWTTLRKLKPAITHIKSQIRDNDIPTRLIYGRHDRIILPVVGERFQKGIEAQCTLKVIASGHQVLHEKHFQEIILALNS